MFKKLTHALLLTSMLSGVAFAGETIDTAYQKMAVYGFNRSNGELRRYDFKKHKLTVVGDVQTSDGTKLSTIDGAGYIPGFENIIGFYTPQNSNTRMVYVNTENAQATLVGQDLGAAAITGATAGPNGVSVASGLININPNNSTDGEFVLLRANGTPIFRDQLHQSATVDSEGTLYAGDAYYCRVIPKGNGNQNGLSIDGNAFTIQNGTQYTLVGTMTVRLYNDHVQNGKAMGHWWLQISAGTVNIAEDGTVLHGGGTGSSPWALYAFQKGQTVEPDTTDFTITGNNVVPSEPYALKITVLGAAISYSGQYNMPVTGRVSVNGTTSDPFGSYSLPITGNLNDGKNPRSYTYPSLFPANSKVSIIGQSWQKKSGKNINGKKDTDYTSFMEVNGSSSQSAQLKVLRNGDPVPNLSGFMNQNSIADFVKNYVDSATKKIKLEVNQAIFLYELGTTNLSSSAADFQDLVALVTLAPSVEKLQEAPTVTTTPQRLIKVNHLTGGYSQLMTLSRDYEALASLDGLNFYATSGGKLYKLSVVDQTETLVGNMSLSDVKALEFAGTTLMAFDNNTGKLVPLSLTTGAPISSSSNIDMSNLGTIVFMPLVSDPTVAPNAYD